MKRGTIVAWAVAGAVVVATAIGVGWALTRAPTASDATMAYFAALESGDAEGALAFARVPDEAHDATVAAYSAVAARVADARVIAATGEARTAEVTVEFTIDGQRRESTLTVTADDSGWTSSDAVAAVAVTTTLGDSVSIGDSLIATADGIVLLPGRYEVTAAPMGLVEGSQTVDVEPGTDVEVAVEASLAPAATSVAQQQLDAYADDCTAPTTTVPTNCGLRIPWAADLATLSTLEFHIDQRPQLALAPDGRTFSATDGIVIATATGTTRAGAPASFTYRADDWALRGSVSFQGNEMVLAVD